METRKKTKKTRLWPRNDIVQKKTYVMVYTGHAVLFSLQNSFHVIGNVSISVYLSIKTIYVCVNVDGEGVYFFLFPGITTSLRATPATALRSNRDLQRGLLN
jgi:hypothetical protein